MYEFYYGSKEEVLANEEKYLLFLKRLLPRWANGIPDSEYLALFNILKNKDYTKKKPVLVETGSGASSLVLFYIAAKYGGKVYSWDTNGSKASFLRTVVSDNIAKLFCVNLHEIWTFVEFSSCDPHLGIPILGEFDDKVDCCFLDSWHTWDNVQAELELLLPHLSMDCVVAIDDANYRNKSYNYQFVNMLRKKIGLPSIDEPEDNICEHYYTLVEKFLQSNVRTVSKIEDTYKKTYQDDVFFKYYSIDKEVMGDVGMEKTDELDHRFDAWQIEI